jgi:hypothetical protein
MYNGLKQLFIKLFNGVIEDKPEVDDLPEEAFICKKDLEKAVEDIIYKNDIVTGDSISDYLCDEDVMFVNDLSDRIDDLDVVKVDDLDDYITYSDFNPEDYLTKDDIDPDNTIGYEFVKAIKPLLKNIAIVADMVKEYEEFARRW